MLNNYCFTEPECDPAGQLDPPPPVAAPITAPTAVPKTSPVGGSPTNSPLTQSDATVIGTSAISVIGLMLL